MATNTLILNKYYENSKTYYIFDIKNSYKANIGDLPRGNPDAIDNYLNNQYLSPSNYRSYDDNYYYTSDGIDIAEGDDQLTSYKYTFYNRMFINQTFEDITTLYVAEIDDQYLTGGRQGVPITPVEITGANLKNAHPELLTGLLISNIAAGNKILASDMELFRERFQTEMNRRDKTTDSDAQTVWENKTQKTAWSTTNTLSIGTLSNFTSGNKATASHINQFINLLNTINTNSYWSDTTAITTGNLLNAIINLETTLTRLEAGVNEITLNGIGKNYDNSRGYPVGNTSGCSSACMGLCQSCLGSCIGGNAGNGGGDSGCPGDCTGSGCTGSCYGGCMYSCWAAGVSGV